MAIDTKLAAVNTAADTYIDALYDYMNDLTAGHKVHFVPIANLATNGFVFNEGFYHPDVNAVGSPAFDKSGKPQYVVTCGGPNLKAKFMRDEIGPRLARLSRKITVALAGRAL